MCLKNSIFFLLNLSSFMHSCVLYSSSSIAPCSLFFSILTFQAENIGQVLNCDIKLHSNDGESERTLTQSLTNQDDGLETTLAQQYTYDPSKTSVITDIQPSRVGTGGGVLLTLTGTGFQISPSITVDGVACKVVSIVVPNTITCRTQPANKTSLDALLVLEFTGGAGRAVPQAKLQVVDVWSSPYSWGNNPPPKKGRIFILCE